MRRKLRLAIFKFASCDGCQLSLLDAEDELLTIFDRIDIAHFAEASSDLQSGPYDVGLVEGSITTPDDAQRIRQVRQDCRFLITIGACATAGGIQALRNSASVDQWMRSVYPHPEFIETLSTSTPIKQHVLVDFELPGCPINQHQLVTVLIDLAEGRSPRVPSYSVCLDCKLKGNVCHLVARNQPCLGPVTHTGCGAICPSYNRACYGCFGPSTPANTRSLCSQWQKTGHAAEELKPLFRTFNVLAPAYEEASRQLTILK